MLMDQLASTSLDRWGSAPHPPTLQSALPASLRSADDRQWVLVTSLITLFTAGEVWPWFLCAERH